ncbi:MAG: tetratricopeptide repeat protein [Vicinamibacterales bacterium]
MARKLMNLGVVLAGVAVFVLATATPALAQVGSLRGKVVDEAGNGVEGAEIVFDFVGDYTRQIKVTTGKNGEWVKAGMPSNAPGTSWTMTVTKGDLSARRPGVMVKIGEMVRMDDVVLRPGGASAKVATDMTAAEVAKANKRQEELAALFDEAGTLIKAGDLDGALAKITTINTEVENCAACYEQIGAIQFQKGDLAAAETAYLKAIEINDTVLNTPKPQPYAALATIYNQQRKFDEAGKMSEKANALSGDATGGGGSAETVYNQGIILWNQSKQAEAQVQFEKAIKLDPNLADAHYWLGMALVSQGKMQEAKTPFETYLKLAPEGENAATAKAILAQIK